MDGFDELLWRLSRQLANIMGAQITFSNGLEPYIEFDEGVDGVVLTAEIPGIRPECIRVSVCEDEIKLDIVQNGVMAYSEVFETDLIKAGEARIRCRNDVLEVRVPYADAGF
ncbi:MAG: Hsp20/alpha crystallin family protein [Candidatus Altiarchaeota archaeon]